MDRTLAILTQEDKEQSINLPLLNTLRVRSHKNSQIKISSEPNPPSFYEADQLYWQRKFAQSVIERQKFKKDYLKGQKDFVLNTNDNIVP